MADVDDLLGPHEALVTAEVVDHSAPAALDHERAALLARVHGHDRFAVDAVAQGDGVSRASLQQRVCEGHGHAVGRHLEDGGLSGREGEGDRGEAHSGGADRRGRRCHGRCVFGVQQGREEMGVALDSLGGGV